MWLAGGLLCMDMVFVVDVLVESNLGRTDGSEGVTLTFSSTRPMESGSMSVEASGVEPSPLSVPWLWVWL
jgi:hypothetical protein